jgi:hypothetical protein
LNATANCSKEVWEFESLPRSAREALKFNPTYNHQWPPPLGGRFPFYTPTRHSPHTHFLV